MHKFVLDAILTGVSADEFASLFATELRRSKLAPTEDEIVESRAAFSKAIRSIKEQSEDLQKAADRLAKDCEKIIHSLESGENDLARKTEKDIKSVLFDYVSNRLSPDQSVERIYDIVYPLFKKRIYSIKSAFLDEEDAKSSVRIKIWEFLLKYTAPNSNITDEKADHYILAMIRNELIRLGKEATKSNSTTDISSENIHVLFEDTSNVEDSVYNDNLIPEVWDKISFMKDSELFWEYSNGMSYQKIADKFGLKKDNVRYRIEKFAEKSRQLLNKDFEDIDF